MKKKVMIGVILSCFLLLVTPCINAIEYKELKETYDDYIEKEFELLNEPLFIILLLILSIVDIPLVIISLIVSMVVYLIYVPTQIMAYIYQNYFWEDDPLIPDNPPMIIVFIIFAILLIFTGLPIIFMMGAILYFINLGYEDFSDYFKSAGRIYADFISNLLRLGFGS